MFYIDRMLRYGNVTGQYNVEDDCRRVSKAVLSPFKSRTQRITGLLDNHVPGPGAYSPHQAPVPVRKTTLV